MQKLNFWVPLEEPKWHTPVGPSIGLPGGNQSDFRISPLRRRISYGHVINGSYVNARKYPDSSSDVRTKWIDLQRA